VEKVDAEKIHKKPVALSWPCSNADLINVFVRGMCARWNFVVSLI
jgi:hypothetical protein